MAIRHCSSVPSHAAIPNLNSNMESEFGNPFGRPGLQAARASFEASNQLELLAKFQAFALLEIYVQVRIGGIAVGTGAALGREVNAVSAREPELEASRLLTELGIDGCPHRATRTVAKVVRAERKSRNRPSPCWSPRLSPRRPRPHRALEDLQTKR
jgi:hypothetical protein